MNNVAGIWLKGRYVDKMPMYFRPGKIICILKESSVQSMKNPHIKFGSTFKAYPTLYDGFKASPSPLLCSSKSHK